MMKKCHKWCGLLFCFFMLMFCLSGIVLNHRTLVAGTNISRKWLPESFRFNNWNNGLLRGTLPYPGKDSVKHILLYGNSGIWKTNTRADTFTDFNKGLPTGADFRHIRNIVQTPSGDLFATGQFGIYRYETQEWKKVVLPQEEERLSDITVRGDTLIVTGRSFLYSASPPYTEFRKLTVKAPREYDGKVSLFRTIWLIHSGEIFGITGKILMDTVAVILIILCVTGVLYWILPKYIKKIRHTGQSTKQSIRLLKNSFVWHNRTGRMTFILTLFICLTGWSLRPPIMIALVYGRVPAIPKTTLHSPNAWNDRLRMLRYDNQGQDWLLSTSEGMFVLESLDAVPVKIEKTPPISIMGLNVFQKNEKGNWLIGSFSGLFLWDRQQQLITDYFTGKTIEVSNGSPFGKKAISGYSDHFEGKECIAEYTKGTGSIPMPKEFISLPMSLWNLCLEIHTGRIYTILGKGTLVFIFFAGLIAIWCLWSGYVIRKR